MPIEVLIINIVLCVLGIVPAFGLQMATVMGGAAVGAGPLGARIAVLGYIFPAMPVISIIGSWVAHLLGIAWLSAVFVALPWVYTLALGVLLLVFLRAPKTPV
jgi:hypothetical protein